MNKGQSWKGSLKIVQELRIKIKQLEKENRILVDTLAAVSDTLYALHTGNGICPECKKYVKVDNRECVGCGK